jgi:AcrR family transcriptional regulator
MKSASTDPRAQRTRQMLRQALMQIVIEKPFRDLTIRDITTRAGINRATFYLRYDDKYDLLKNCADELFAELRKMIESEIDFDPSTDLPEPFDQHVQRTTIILQHFQQYNAFYKAMFGKDLRT